MKKVNKKTIICVLVATILAVVTNIATILYYEPSESEIAEIKVDVVEDVEVEDVENVEDGCKYCEEMHNLHFEEVRA